ncbi:general transcription factor 3C polypeptide 5 [Athalia rosae]|uniref:general transcription factor 3C polypeptide 5 n=1 Tax=Athalia rosae TaxID=37344 RepID=UPI0020347819|nr:general transcription factor 3C polypeptide 5 [Athalia rosae]
MSSKGDFSDEEAIDNNNDDSDSDFNIGDYEDEPYDSDESLENGRRNAGKEQHSQNEVDDDNYPEEREYIGPVLPGGHRFDRKFVCIKYPGNVINTEKAIETLGGLTSISTAVDTRNRRLELRFRPADGYCKPACGDRHVTTGFLLKVKVKNKRIRDEVDEQKTTAEVVEVINMGTTEGPRDFEDSVNSNQETLQEKSNTAAEVRHGLNELTSKIADCSLSPDHDRAGEGEDHDTEDATGRERKDSNTDAKFKESCLHLFEKNKYKDLSQDADYELPELAVLGQVDTEFRFMNLCDFQYLPITPSMKNPGENECIYDSIYPVNVPPYSWLKNKVPYFLPPAAFSRMDNVQLYVPKTGTDSAPENVIGKTRKRRAGYSNFINFHTPAVPTHPPKGIENAMRVKFLQTFHLERVRKFFEQRPIWSKNALMYETKFTSEQLKILLPSVAYYFMTGPWRIMWVKLGYDPRKDPTARIYQTLDYRLKAMHGLESTVKCKRSYSNYILPYKLAPASKPKTTVLSATWPENDRKKEKHLHKNVYLYEEGTVPPSRQMFYQYCDVHVDEIQEMLSKLPDPTPDTKCHEKMGWLPVGFDDHCREIINKQVRGVLRKQMNIPEDYPTSLPRKRKFKSKIKLGRFNNKQSKNSHLINPDSTSIHMEVIPGGSDDEWEEVNESEMPSTSRQDS